MEKNQPKYISILIYIGALGLYTFFTGLLGGLSPLVLFPALLFVTYKISRNINIKYIVTALKELSLSERFLTFIIFAQALLYALAVLVPETGFDALWYHLPLAKVYAATGNIAPIPQLLYSTIPRLGEMYFTLALVFTDSLIAVKVVSFVFFIAYITLSYHLARKFIDRTFALLTVAIISSSLVLAWQAGSAYVDTIAAVFQLGSLLALLPSLTDKKSRLPAGQVIVVGALAGFALSTKMLTLPHVLALTALILAAPSVPSKKRIQSLSLVYLSALIVSFPWYLDNFISNGHPLYPTNLPDWRLVPLEHAGGFTSLISWVVYQLSRLPLLLYHLTYTGSGFLTPVILILLPLIIVTHKKLTSRPYFFLLTYTLVFLGVWWFIPPPETRYMLAALPPLIIIGISALRSVSLKHSQLKRIALTALYISIAINFAARAYASRKYIRVIFGSQSTEQYVESQTTPFNKEVIDRFYSGYWDNYTYTTH